MIGAGDVADGSSRCLYIDRDEDCGQVSGCCRIRPASSVVLCSDSLVAAHQAEQGRDRQSPSVFTVSRPPNPHHQKHILNVVTPSGRVAHSAWMS
jgi:hypothetical protein